MWIQGLGDDVLFGGVSVLRFICVFFFKQKTAYEMRISDWSSDVCSSDLITSPAATLYCLPPVFTTANIGSVLAKNIARAAHRRAAEAALYAGPTSCQPE